MAIYRPESNRGDFLAARITQATIGAGGTNAGSGGDSTFGTFLTSLGGGKGPLQSNRLSLGYGSSYSSSHGSTIPGSGVNGYGAGSGISAGVNVPKANSGQGSSTGTAADGYCLVTWFE